MQAGASYASLIAFQCPRGQFHIRRLECREEGTFVSSVGVDDRSSAWIDAEQIVDGEEATSVLNIFEVLVVESELSGVVGQNGDVEDIHCTSCSELSTEN